MSQADAIDISPAKGKGKGKERAKASDSGFARKAEKSSKHKTKHPNVTAEENISKITQEKSSNTQKKSGRSSFVFQPSSHWHSALPPLKPSDLLAIPTPAQLSTLSSKAAQLHESDVQLFQSSSSSSGNLAHSSSSSSEVNFLSKIIQSGTLSDRLSALTLMVQSSPVHNLKALEMLKGMAERGKGKGGREESLKALRCIVDWWVGGGVPDRKLR